MSEALARAHELLRDLRNSRDYEKWVEQFPLPPDTVVEPLGFAPGRWVTVPESATNRVVLHLHGGAYLAGSARTHTEMAARIAGTAHARVALPEYPTTPDHPFPAAMDSAVAAYTALLDVAPPHRIAITGESAGGGLAIATLLRLRDEGTPLPAAVAVCSPWVDMGLTGASMITRADRDPFVSYEFLKFAAGRHLNGHNPGDPYVSPLHGDLTGLPPLLIQVGTEEVLYADALRLQLVAERAGVRSELLIARGAPHIWQHFASFLPEARDSIQAIGDHIIGSIPSLMS